MFNVFEEVFFVSQIAEMFYQEYRAVDGLCGGTEQNKTSMAPTLKFKYNRHKESFLAIFHRL